MTKTKNPRVLMIGLTPPLEGGSQRHIYEISSKIKNTEVLTQKGTICKNGIGVRLINKPVFLRNVLFSIWVRIYTLYLLLTLKKRYDAIHIHENLAYFCAIPLSWRYNVIITVHGIKGFKFYENKFLWFFFKQGLRAAKKIICVDLVEKEMLEREGFRNVEHISNGVDINIYKEIKKKAEPKITFVGRIHRQKGVEYLMKAFDVIKDRYPKYKLEIVGKKEGELFEKLSKEFVDRRIIWKGFILDRKKLFSEIASSEILVFPSLWEALPWPALLEGLASGRPVIASNLIGMNKIFESGKNIVLFEPGNVNQLVDRLERLIRDEKLRKRIGAEGKKTASKYSWDTIAKKTNEVYNKL